MRYRIMDSFVRPCRVALCFALLLLSGVAGGYADDISPFNELNAVAEIPISAGYAANIVQSGDLNEGHVAVVQGAGNMTAIEQAGVTNYAAIIQDGDLNIASQYQQGAGNEARISQQGAGNKSAQQQLGNNNFVTTTQIGNNNYISATQTSNGNYLSQTQTGNGLSYSITQTGAMILTINQTK